MVKKIGSVDEFNDALKNAGNKLVVIDFFADWCGPCKVLAPKLEDLSAKEPDVLFLKVDVDELEELAQKYSISAMPTILYFRGGVVIETVVGANLPLITSKVAELKASAS